MRRALSIVSLRRRASRAKPLNVVLGCGDTRFKGWFGTDQHILDVRAEQDWAALFREDSIDRLLAEHLFEHLSEDDCAISFRLCRRYLRPGGRLRVAVPDGYRLDPKYIADVAPPSDGHQVLFQIDLLGSHLVEAGFRIEPLEYFDANGEFHTRQWNPADGYVMRSSRFDRSERFLTDALGYTSLIVDAIKE